MEKMESCISSPTTPLKSSKIKEILRITEKSAVEAIFTVLHGPGNQTQRMNQQ